MRLAFLIKILVYFTVNLSMFSPGIRKFYKGNFPLAVGYVSRLSRYFNIDGFMEYFCGERGYNQETNLFKTIESIIYLVHILEVYLSQKAKISG